MFRSPVSAVLLLVAALVAGGAHAVELGYGVRGEAIYDDNVFFQSEGEVKDWSIRTTPHVEFQDDRGQVNWRFRYAPAYEYYVDLGRLSAWDHLVEGSASWRPTQRWRLTLSDTFVRFNSVARLNDLTGADVDDGTTGLETFDTLRRFTRNTLNARAEYAISPRASLTFGGNWTIWDFSLETRRDQESTALQAQYLYAINQQFQAGLSGSWRTQEFGRVPGTPRKDKTNFYNVSFDFVWQLSPNSNLRFSAGPAWVDGEDPFAPNQFVANTRLTRPFELPNGNTDFAFIDATTCPEVDGFIVAGPECDLVRGPGGRVVTLTEFVIPDPDPDVPAGTLLPAADQPFPELLQQQVVPLVGGVDPADVELTYFADVAYTHTWDNWELFLSYRRQDDQSSGVDSSSVADIVFGRVRYAPSRVWSFTFVGSWTQREQEGDLLVFDQTTVEAAPFLLNEDSPVFTPGFLPLTPDPAVLRGAFPNSARSTGVLARALGFSTELTSIRLSFEVRRRFTKRLTMLTTLLYNQDDSTGSLRVSRKTSRFSVRVGVIYEFEPIRFNGS